ncbi:MAG TPA: hypothetical protein DD417_08555 [Elusimicrobia bacterium]|nr:hypothetical protein [Elusimicrobiota bacterium]
MNEGSPLQRVLSLFLTALAFVVLQGLSAVAVLETMDHPAVPWAGAALFLLLGSWAARQRRWSSSAVFGVGALFVFHVCSQMEGCESYVREGSNRGNLGALRQRVAEVRSRTGIFPAELDLSGIRSPRIPEHRAVLPGAVHGSTPTDSGRWGYDPASGTVFVDCTHLTRQSGLPWNGY